MIETLRIEEVKIVQQAELEFGPGLNVLTGETGAGKSIILGALALLAGGRGSPDAVRNGAQRGSIEAIFGTESQPDFEAELSERGFEFQAADGDEGHELLVHRTVSLSGRSRARVSGQLVPISTLAELFSGRMEIASQHSSQALLRPENHGLLLDTAGGILPQRESLRACFAEIREIDGELANLRNQQEERERRRDFLAYQLDEIDAVSPTPEEFEQLGHEQKRLGHAEELREDGSAIVALLQGDEMGLESANAIDLLARAAGLAAGLAEIDPALTSQVERLRTLEVEVREIARDVERHGDGIESDPGRLTVIEDRLGQIERLRRKYGREIEAILTSREEFACELASIEGSGKREGELEAERRRLVLQLEKEADRLSEARKKAARKFGRSVQKAVADLDLPDARFEVGLEPAACPANMPCSSLGNESTEFKFSANAGEELSPLRKVASGGELSRIFLAIKNGLRTAGGGMVLVFDEVDAGIGGRAAQRVGRSLAELSRHHQVICITHLPQIAAFADVHFRVEKVEAGERTCATVTRLADSARVDEIARMAGGERVTAATRRHARDLLKANTLD